MINPELAKKAFGDKTEDVTEDAVVSDEEEILSDILEHTKSLSKDDLKAKLHDFPTGDLDVIEKVE
jgi:hypothetical protein